MKKTKNLFILSLVLTLFSCSQADNKTSAVDNKPTADSAKNAAVGSPSPDSVKFQTAWDNFVNAVKASDFKALKAVSTDCIRCSECLNNTDKENLAYQKLLDKASKEKDGDSIIKTRNYLPIDKFIKEDFSIEFGPELKARLADSKNISIAEPNRQLYTNCCISDGIQMANPTIKEVSVNIKGEKKEFDWTASFVFIESKDGYKFCGYSTTP